MVLDLIKIESTPDLVEQVYASLPDTLAAQLAARTFYRLDLQLLTRGRLAARGRDIKAMMAADAAFHTAIYVASGNPLIMQTAQTHWLHIRRAMGAVLQVSTTRESIWDEPEAIAKAIARGDEDQAEKLIRQHGEDAGQNLATLLTKAIQQNAR